MSWVKKMREWIIKSTRACTHKLTMADWVVNHNHCIHSTISFLSLYHSFSFISRSESFQISSNMHSLTKAFPFWWVFSAHCRKKNLYFAPYLCFRSSTSSSSSYFHSLLYRRFVLIKVCTQSFNTYERSSKGKSIFKFMRFHIRLLNQQKIKEKYVCIEHSCEQT